MEKQADHWHDHNVTFAPIFLDACLQSVTQQHYTGYDEVHLKPIMQHMAKNVVSVNEGLTKHAVSSCPTPVASVVEGMSIASFWSFFCRLSRTSMPAVSY